MIPTQEDISAARCEECDMPFACQMIGTARGWELCCAKKGQDMTEHTFAPGDRAYHVVRREIVVLSASCERNYPLACERGGLFTCYGESGRASETEPMLLPPWHPDVPERCREQKPKRKVEVVAEVSVSSNGMISTRIPHTSMEHLNSIRGRSVELRGSYEVDE